MLAERVRRRMIEVACQGQPITYQALALKLELVPPNTIRQLTTALEELMEQDAAAGHPLIAALVVSKATQGLPRQGFFECAHRLGCFQGDLDGSSAAHYYQSEFDSAVTFWGSADH